MLSLTGGPIACGTVMITRTYIARIYHATSSDGLDWLILPGSWDDAEVADPHVVLTGNDYQMWFAGYDGQQWRTGYAYFTYGGGWVKYEGNPVLSEGDAGEWDSRYAAGPSVLRSGETYHMYYFGYNGFRFQIGYAVDSTSVGGIEDAFPDVPVPPVFSLEQNHPNPFNPVTMIRFTVPGGPGEKFPVNLTIYTMRGRQVTRLIDSELEPGSHKVVWNGRDNNGRTVSSGIYLYTLKSGDKIYTKKMVMAK